MDNDKQLCPVSEDEVKQLYLAKCKDMDVPIGANHWSNFRNQIMNASYGRKLKIMNVSGSSSRLASEPVERK